MILEGITLEEAREVLKDLNKPTNKFVYVALADLYESELSYHIVREEKLSLWLTRLSSTKEIAYIYEAVEDNDGELIQGKWIQNVELNKL